MWSGGFAGPALELPCQGQRLPRVQTTWGSERVKNGPPPADSPVTPETRSLRYYCPHSSINNV